MALDGSLLRLNYRHKRWGRCTCWSLLTHYKIVSINPTYCFDDFYYYLVARCVPARRDVFNCSPWDTYLLCECGDGVPFFFNDAINALIDSLCCFFFFHNTYNFKQNTAFLEIIFKMFDYIKEMLYICSVLIFTGCKYTKNNAPKR